MSVSVHHVVTGRTSGPVVTLSHSRAAHLANVEQPGLITPALIEHLEQS
jgi:hypothetical protein